MARVGVLVLGVASVVASVAASVVVNVGSDLKVRGAVREVGAGRRMVAAFTGIRYAVAENVMAAPELIGDYGGRTLDATRPGGVCPSMDAPGELPAELRHLTEAADDATRDADGYRTLDVFVPAEHVADVDAALDVYVHVHGGTNVGGSRTAGINAGAGLLRDGGRRAVVVVVEYALGPLGFWYDADSPNTNNVALREIILALHWVQRRVIYFGGDPGKVTLGGHSAGAALAQHVHVALADWARFGFGAPPFRRLLLMSGTAGLLAAATPAQALERQRRFLAHLDECRGVDAAETRFCVSLCPMERIRAAALASRVPWTVVADGVTLPAGRASDLIAAGHYMPVESVHMTVTTNETAAFLEAAQKRTPALRDNMSVFGAWLLLTGSPIVATRIAEHYSASDAFAEVVRSTSDAFFAHPAFSMRDAYRRSHTPAGLAFLSERMDRLDNDSLVGRSVRLLSDARATPLGRLLTDSLHHLGPAGGHVRAAVDRLDDVRASLETVARMGAFHGLDQCFLFDPPTLRVRGRGIPFSELISPEQCRVYAVVMDYVGAGALRDEHPGHPAHPAVLNQIDVAQVLATFLHLL